MTESNVWIVIPCYNEEKILPKIYERFVDELHDMKQNNIADNNSIILFVDDGSSDNTWNIISSISEKYKDVHGLKLERNAGQQCAILAGLMTAKKNGADATITIDCDGQDDIHAMTQMMQAFNSGYDIVYGVRNDRSCDTFIKRNAALVYYRLIRLFDRNMICNHGDFRLMSKNVLDYIDAHGEHTLFLRKLCSTIDYNYENIKSVRVYHKRLEREAGETHYSLSMMFQLAIHSLRPVHHKIGHASHKNQYMIKLCTYKSIML